MPLSDAGATNDTGTLTRKFMDVVTAGKVEAGGIVGKYAYGFGDKIFNGRHIVGHNGGASGVGANLDMFPEPGYTAIILTNYDPPAMMPVIMKIRTLASCFGFRVWQQADGSAKPK